MSSARFCRRPLSSLTQLSTSRTNRALVECAQEHEEHRGARGPFRRKGLPLRSFAARTMPVTGLLLLLFIIFHILDSTTGTRPVASLEYTPKTATRSFAYDNLVHSFDRPWVSAFYIAAMLLLGWHLSHGPKRSRLPLSPRSTTSGSSPGRGGTGCWITRNGQNAKIPATETNKVRPRLHETPVHFEHQTQFR